MKSTDRVRALRQRRSAQGLVRMEVYIMPDEKQALADFLKQLEQKRRARKVIQ